MGRFIITEEEKKHIRGLYEQNTGSTVDQVIQSAETTVTPALELLRRVNWIPKKSSQGDMFFSFKGSKLILSTKDGKTFIAFNSDYSPLKGSEEKSKTIVYDNDDNFYNKIITPLM